MNASIIQQNNDAVHLLRRGYCNDASSALKCALLRLQLSFRHTSSLESESVDLPSDAQDVPHIQRQAKGVRDTFSFKHTIMGPESSESPAPLVAISIEYENKHQSDPSDAFLALYSRAFYLPLNETRERVLSSVILYNCALASHLSGVCRQGDSQNLNNARMLYKYAFRILQEGNFEMDSIQLLWLALYNNLGHVSFQLFHLEEAGHYVKCLRAEMGLSDEDDLGATLPTIEDDDYDFFCFNVAVHVELMGAPAA